MSDIMEDSDSAKNSAADNATYQNIPDADHEMGCLALQEFEHGKYEQCVGTLKKLYSERFLDSKVFHNSCVAEYYLSGCIKTENFNKKMIEVCKQARIDIQDIESLDDVDNSVILYNQAVVLYHLHQYHAAILILDKVFQFIEPLEETLAQNICFLLLELYLCVYQARKALCFVGYTETMLFSSNKNSCSKSNQKENDNHQEDNGESCMTESSKRRLQLCKARCYAMIKTSKACKREIKNLMSSGSGIQNIPAFYLKSQLEYQRGNYRKALKLLNSATLPDNMLAYFKESGDCLPAIFYNNVSCIHFYMGKPHLGQFYMKKAIAEFEESLKPVTVHSKSKLNSRPLHLMSISTRHQLIYNLGMQYLQGQRFQEAFECFTEVVHSYHSNPRLWLRIAECCIHIHKPDNTNQFVECKKKSFVKSIVGAGPHRKLILSSSASNESLIDMIKSSIDLGPTLKFAMLALNNALMLLPEHRTSSVSGETCLHSHLSTDDGDSNNAEENTLLTLPANFIQSAEISSLRNSILIASSYVSLCLGDVILAHEYANMLLSQPRISGAHKFLAHLYAGESLLLMDKITESVEHLNFPHVNDVELAFPASSPEISLKHQMRFDSKLNEKNDDGSRPVGNIPNWFPNTISSARFISHYNLAVAYALREEWSKATECILLMNPEGEVPEQALSLLIYVQYHQGLTDKAMSYVKQFLSTSR